MKIKRTGGRTPVILAERSKSRRRLARGRENVLDPDALTAPVPGSMLVLLSRLHRSERAPAPFENSMSARDEDASA